LIDYRTGLMSRLAMWPWCLDSQCSIRIFPKIYSVRGDVLSVPTMEGFSFSGRSVRLDGRQYLAVGEPSVHVWSRRWDGSIDRTYMRLTLEEIKP